jgi:CubicO group peptidase (beta-lactamase class C family)
MPQLPAFLRPASFTRYPRREGHVAVAWRAAVMGMCICFYLGNAEAQTSLNSLLKTEAQQAGFPALAAAVVSKGRLVATGAVGTRRAGTTTPVQANDRFHIGSDTKAMTSLLAAMLIEEGKLRWNITLAEIFPELAATMDAGVRRVTVNQLMSHSSGFPADTPDFEALIAKGNVQPGDLNAQRYWLLQQVVTQPLASEPGTSFAYSNLGYTVLGAVIERKAGKTWEELITERVFTPLGLSTAGIGPQASVGRVDAPLGHNLVDGNPVPVLGGPNADSPLLIGPAGTVHMSVQDFARWGGWMAGQGKRPPYLVKPETMKRLVTPVISMSAKASASTTVAGGAEYALGWASRQMPWTIYPLAFHGGSNSMNKAYIWLDTKRDACIVIMSNVAAPNTDEVMLQLGGKLYKQFIASAK